MKNNESMIFVFIASIIIGVLISLNFNFKRTSNSFQISAQQYQEAYNQRNKLYSEISNLRESNHNMTNKINKYKYSDSKAEKLIEDVNKELNYNKMIAGFSSVKGKGIKMIIRDGSTEFPEGDENNILILLRTLHDDDMIKVVNELKVAGAQAIAINNQRVLPNTEIFCSWAFLRINGEQIPAPFVVNVVGDPDVLENTLMRDDGFIRTLINRGIEVEISKENEMIMPAEIGTISYDNLTLSSK
ncbi:hypothetical protein CPJCM30710_06450 [Clostridium polyendosporum]|uniref:Division initiation protein n=1 Tax=Clostridium polyendosporum TaxID=69208 RepID=A0A919RYA4_9CLOT|nr:DUF881 domain-containing protein [Clostridium polyendosporum]GIM27979.1 hypothetical protein CPJCM30710_06450 [Clostridium polyendosporum]